MDICLRLCFGGTLSSPIPFPISAGGQGAINYSNLSSFAESGGFYFHNRMIFIRLLCAFIRLLNSCFFIECGTLNFTYVKIFPFNILLCVFIKRCAMIGDLTLSASHIRHTLPCFLCCNLQHALHFCWKYNEFRYSEWLWYYWVMYFSMYRDEYKYTVPWSVIIIAQQV